MRYFLYLPLAIAFKLLAKILSPILPLFAEMRWGPGAGENEEEYAPRLPWWLDWFMMDDHPLWGGDEWRNRIQPTRWNKYSGMALWLLRNSGVNFGRYALAVSPDDPKAWQKRSRWQITPSFAIETNVGWHLDHPNRLSGLSGYVTSIKFKRTKSV